ncbi:hypothetical protein LOAG_08387 [Loa loa]|uniref:Uncharacterized protein n=1 Tax=Loa loa TaxID=7209 RepID=A0A1S0TTU5_LOALO|nr:hypothetical protein LOAG_08387 [Loa loa]EFO20101.1 hypothetical protein LOAG_08387 [Loa loa]
MTRSQALSVSDVTDSLDSYYFTDYPQSLRFRRYLPMILSGKLNYAVGKLVMTTVISELRTFHQVPKVSRSDMRFAKMTLPPTRFIIAPKNQLAYVTTALAEFELWRIHIIDYQLFHNVDSCLLKGPIIFGVCFSQDSKKNVMVQMQGKTQAIQLPSTEIWQ